MVQCDQYLTRDFPVLSAGPTPHTPLDRWTLQLDGLVDTPRTWTWDEFLALPRETFTTDIHCVTKWSKLDTEWEGVSLDMLLDGNDDAGSYLIAHCDGGYTTNLPLEDVTGGKACLDRLRVRRRAPGAGARRPGPPPRASSLFLEECQVGPPSRARR
jgi:DMSO/TMAO reductase YedYZ molybdopterin-dependent catalytic subunit